MINKLFIVILLQQQLSFIVCDDESETVEKQSDGKVRISLEAD